MSSQNEPQNPDEGLEQAEPPQLEKQVPESDLAESPADPRGMWILIIISVLVVLIVGILAWQLWPSDESASLSPEAAATRAAEAFATATLIPLFTPQGPSILPLSVPEMDPDGVLTVVGRVNRGASVDVWVNGELNGSAVVDEDGIWSYDLVLDTPGLYEISASGMLGGEPLDMDGEAARVIVPTVTPTPSATPSSTATSTATATATWTPTATPSPTTSRPSTRIAAMAAAPNSYPTSPRRHCSPHPRQASSLPNHPSK